MRVAGPPGPRVPGSASEWMMTSKRGRPRRAPQQPRGSVHLPAEPLRGQNPHRHATWGRRRWRPGHHPSVGRSERPRVGTRQPRCHLQVTLPEVATAIPGGPGGSQRLTPCSLMQILRRGTTLRVMTTLSPERPALKLTPMERRTAPGVRTTMSPQQHGPNPTQKPSKHPAMPTRRGPQDLGLASRRRTRSQGSCERSPMSRSSWPSRRPNLSSRSLHPPPGRRP